MKVDYEPWHDSHRPQNFARHDTTGRHSPLHIPRVSESWYTAVLIGVFFGCVFALILWAAI